MSVGYPNGPHLSKKTLVHTERNSIHGCSDNSVSEEALLAVLHGRDIISLNIVLSFLEKVKATVTVKLA